METKPNGAQHSWAGLLHQSYRALADVADLCQSHGMLMSALRRRRPETRKDTQRRWNCGLLRDRGCRVLPRLLLQSLCLLCLHPASPSHPPPALRQPLRAPIVRHQQPVDESPSNLRGRSRTAAQS